MSKLKQITKDTGDSPDVFVRLAPAKPTEVYKTYWRFAVKRQNIFFKRFNDSPPPWTEDSILRKHKFTNAYRVLDRASQYLIKNVISQGNDSPTELFFRILIFKVFNKIETWELLKETFETITYKDYSFKHYDNLLTKALDIKRRIFSAAYIMPSGNSSFGYTKKHRNLLRLIELMIEDDVPLLISETSSMQKAFELLRSYPMIGDFLAYQLVIDINYSELTNFSEMEFVVPGPGAKDGIRKCFHSLGGLNEAEIIKFMSERQEQEFGYYGLDFESLWGRRLQLIDCQNLFCEVDKYARVAHPDISGKTGRTRIKQIYKMNPKPIEYWFPPKWNINELAGKQRSNVNKKMYEG